MAAGGGGRRWPLPSTLLFALLALGACNPAASPDVRDGALDAIDAPRPTLDGATDATLDAQACVGPALEDLATLGARTADGVVYTDNNLAAPQGLGNSVQPSPACNFQIVYERLFQYTMQTTAALRVSTNNADTDRGFDSVLFLTPAPCMTPLESLGCNDDDPSAAPGAHVGASTVVSPVLAAGTTVIIGVGGFYPMPESGQGYDPGGALGQFQLTVREVQPLAPLAECDASGRTSVCPRGTTCVLDGVQSGRSTCLPDGAMPGAACHTGTCDAPLACDVNANRCFAVVASGGVCDRLGFAIARCADGTSCIPTVRGTRTGTCRTAGTAPLAACAAENTCDPGLACRVSAGGNVCLRAVAAGAPCSTFDTLCAEGFSCVPRSPGGVQGVCTPNGTLAGSACRAGVPECDGALFCISSWVDRTCRTVGRAPGDPCGPNGVCSYDWQCVASDPTIPYEGTCAVAGSLGAGCQTVGGTQCTAGLVCTNVMAPAQGRCVTPVTPGGACDLAARVTRCTTGTSCVRATGGGNMGVCVAIGTAAGSLCRPSAPRCDGALTCSAGPTPVCQRASTDGSCSPRDNAVACATGRVCAATGLDVGACRTPIDETEPNDSVPGGVAVPVPAAVSASLLTYDLDCFDVMVPAAGRLFAQLSTFEGQCSASLVLDVYGPDGLLGSDSGSGPFGCPRVDGRDLTAPDWARALPGGRHTVCVRQGSDRRAVQGYVLSLDASGP